MVTLGGSPRPTTTTNDIGGSQDGSVYGRTHTVSHVSVSTLEVLEINVFFSSEAMSL